MDITLIYLPVGHTHEKVDKYLFAPIGTKKKTEDCPIPTDFPSFIKKAFQKTNERPQINQTLLVWDWKTFFKEHSRKLKQFKDFRAFKFVLDKDGEMVMFYKQSILDATWIGFDGGQAQGMPFITWH